MKRFLYFSSMTLVINDVNSSNASGNTMATYRGTFAPYDTYAYNHNIQLDELYIYGNERVGIIDGKYEFVANRPIYYTESSVYGGIDPQNPYKSDGSFISTGFSSLVMVQMALFSCC